MGAMLIGCGLRQSVLTASLGVAFMFVLSLVHGHLAERLKYDGSHPWHSKDRVSEVVGRASLRLISCPPPSSDEVRLVVPTLYIPVDDL